MKIIKVAQNDAKESYERACKIGGFLLDTDHDRSRDRYGKTIWNLVWTAQDGYRTKGYFIFEFVAKNALSTINSLGSVEKVNDYIQRLKDQDLLHEPFGGLLKALKNLADHDPSYEDTRKTELSISNPKHIAFLALVQNTGFDNTYNNDLGDKNMTLYNKTTDSEVWIEWGKGGSIKSAHFIDSSNNIKPLFSRTVSNLISELNQIKFEIMKEQENENY